MPETKAIEKFLREQYSDEKLAALLAHAEDGKLAYHSCCCLVGAANANHPLRQNIPSPLLDTRGRDSAHHYVQMTTQDGAREAEEQYYVLGDDDVERRERVIPLIRAEIARREALRAVDVGTQIPADTVLAG